MLYRKGKMWAGGCYQPAAPLLQQTLLASVHSSPQDSFGWTAWKRWAGMTEAERRKEDWCYVEGFKLLLDGEDSGSVSSSGDGGSSLAPPDELVATGVSSQLPRGKGATEVVSDFLAELRKCVCVYV